MIQPTILTIFGATGDLSLDYLLPALGNMVDEGLLGGGFKLVCVSRRPWTTKEYVSFLKDEFSKKGKVLSEKLVNHIEYFAGDFEHPSSFNPLAEVLGDRDKPHVCNNRLFYFATDPKYFSVLSKTLKSAGLLTSCAKDKRTVRVLVEKPFGTDLASAKKLNKLLLSFFKEQQIYRIDHYLGKEMVQNLLVSRFANDFLEPIWNRQYVERVEISALEDELVGKRVEFYDSTGVIKDFVQNHLLHLLALVAMEQPKKLLPEYISQEKLKVLRKLKKITSTTVQKQVVLGQYEGYRGVGGLKSLTETFAAIKVFVENPRWKGVPFYLRSGKAMGQKVAEISIHFKTNPKKLSEFSEAKPNVLTFQIQPDESVSMRVNNKTVGFGMRLHEGYLAFGYKDEFTGRIPAAYERLLLDFVQGDQRLFLSSAEVEAAWVFVDNLSSLLTKVKRYVYPVGQNGPKQADTLLQKGQSWWTA